MSMREPKTLEVRRSALKLLLFTLPMLPLIIWAPAMVFLSVLMLVTGNPVTVYHIWHGLWFMAMISVLPFWAIYSIWKSTAGPDPYYADYACGPRDAEPGLIPADPVGGRLREPGGR